MRLRCAYKLEENIDEEDLSITVNRLILTSVASEKQHILI